MARGRALTAAPATAVNERLLDLAWSLWAELGVPGWARRHWDWAIDPEPLIMFTALVSARDPRLAGEAISWCVRNARYLSASRLRNLLKDGSAPVLSHWGPFAASVNAHGDAGWPAATEPLPLRLSSKEGLDDFRRPALISLRLRTTLGVSARSELLLYFVAHPDARASAGDLAEVVHYSKRNVEKELAALRKAGLLAAESRRNRLEHLVAQPESLVLFAAPRPAYFPRWDAIFEALRVLLDFEARAGSMEAAVAAVEAHRVQREVARPVRDARLPPPPPVDGAASVRSLRDWTGHLVEALARADAAALGWASAAPAAGLDGRSTPADGVRGVVSPLLASATDLEVWADTRTAQERTPELVRRLILETAPDVERVDMGAGEAVQVGGYDGFVLNRAGTTFVPAGRSVWEIGTSGDVKRKADDDFRKRSTKPGEVDPGETTFVFVTPRRWAAKRLWEREQAKGGLWRAVRVLDADDLETWLSRASSTHLWLSGLLGKSWGSVQDLQSWWLDWREATNPPLSAEVVLAGREHLADALEKRLDESSVLVRVRGDSADEALAFAAAAMARMDRAGALLARSLVINDAAGWNWATSSTTPALLIPRFVDPNVSLATCRGHTVVIPVGREEGSHDDLVLPRLRREALESALRRLGVRADDADDLAARGRASLTSLRRRLALDKGIVRPAWSHRADAPALLPALLAGAWDEAKPGDQDVISALAERPYQEVERVLAGWAQASDPPVRKVGTNWFLVSKEDAWELLSPYLTTRDLDLFGAALLRALGIRDPATDLPPEQRWMANVRGHEHPLSLYLREGLVDTLAVMGARSTDRVLLSGRIGQWHADVLTRALLARANADNSGKLWASLSPVLSLLAEASPEQFLDAVDQALSRDPSPLATLFTDADATTVFVTNSPHTGLLWALENLAWSADYLGRAALQLAALDRLDPGGKLTNRPLESLRSAFLVWDPQTSAPLERRLQALDVLRSKYPDLAWRLLLAILPRDHAISTPSPAPRWRDWKEPRDERVPFEELDRAVTEVVDRLLGDAGVSGERWSDLVRAVADLPWQRVAGALEQLAPESLAEEDRIAVWNALRAAISNHRGYQGAEWALPPAAVDRLAGIYERFAPSDPVRKAAWLFSRRPDLPEGGRRDWRRHEERAQELREAAIGELREQGGAEALLRLAELAPDAELVGRVIGRTAAAGRGDEPARMFDLLDSPEKTRALLARGYAAGRFSKERWDWATPVLEQLAGDWSTEKRAAFLVALDFEPTTWDWAERLGGETGHAYWSRPPWHRINDHAAMKRAAESLVRHGRPDAAVELLAVLVRDHKERIDPEVVAQALDGLLRQAGRDDIGAHVYDVGTLLDDLAAVDRFDASRLAGLEWGFLPLLRRTRPPQVLQRELASNPGFFVEVLALVFRAQGEERSDGVPDDERAKAMLGYQLLESWDHAPGVRDDRTVDEGALNAWVDAARALAAERGRAGIADRQIGRVLRDVPDDPDGVWPNRVVRDLVERIESLDLETGLVLGLRNSRGVTWRGLTDGGEQERALQARYLTYAEQVGGRWPRTAALLRRIARGYADEARGHDAQAEITEDGWS